MNVKSIAFLTAMAACFASSNAYGVLVTETFTGEVVFGDKVGELASGTFTYDDDLIDGVGDEVLLPPDFTLTLSFLGQTFIEEDDTDFPDFPEIVFEDGLPVFIDYLVIDGDGVGDEIADPEIFNFSFIDLIPEPTGGFFIPIETNFIPEPTTAMLAGLAMVGFATRRETRKRQFA